MNICCVVDDNYVQHCSVMLVSLFENNQNNYINVYVLTVGLNEYNIKCISDLISSYNSNCFFYFVDIKLVSHLPIKRWFSLNTYSKFFISKLIPDSVDKVLYLDCDVIINSSIFDLWNIRIDEYAVAAVADPLADIDMKKRIDKLGYDYNLSYFNSGVMLVNLKYWRDNDVFSELIDCVNVNIGKFSTHDQDVFNIVLNKRIIIHPKWNVSPHVFHKNKSAFLHSSFHSIKLIEEAMNSPAILHFLSSPKPWSYGCRFPYSFLYYKYLEKTNFRYYKPSFRFSRKNIILFLGKILRKIKIKREIYVYPLFFD